MLDVNLTSAFLVTRAVVGGMIRRGSGKIINLCSLNCEVSRPTIANYAAAKGIADEEALKIGMDEKSQEFLNEGAAIYHEV